MHTSEDTSVYDKVVTAVFSEDLLRANDHSERGGRLGSTGNNTSSILYTDLNTEVRDHVVEIAKEVFRQHCAKHLEIMPMRLLGDCPAINRFFSIYILWSSLTVFYLSIIFLTHG